jgi:hypothetical protein
LAQKADHEGARKLLRQIDRKKFRIITGQSIDEDYDRYGIKNRDQWDKDLGVKRNKAGKVVRTSGDMYIQPKAMLNPDGTRGTIFVPTHKKTSPTPILHELGHGTGKASRSKGWQNVLGTTMGLKRGVSLVGAGLSGGAALSAKSDEDIARANRINNMSVIAGGLMHAPLLIEEGRANIRAHGLGKKFGVPVRKRQLAAAMGTYAGSALAQTALPWWVNRRIIAHKRRQRAANNAKG